MFAIVLLTTLLQVSAIAEKETKPMPDPSRIAVQLYVFGKPAQRPDEKLDGVLTTVEWAGYHNVQAWLSYYDSPESASRLSELLARHHLAMPAAYTGGVMHDREKATKTIDGILEKAKLGAAHGLKIVILNPDPIHREKTEEELAIQCENLNRLGGALQKLGLRLAIHQHAPEMRSGAREWYYDLRHTDPEKVFFCLDLQWVYRGGQDPYRLLEDAGKRVIDLHLRNSKDGIWMEDFGDGDIDYRRVGRILEKMGYQGYYTVELAHEPKTKITRALGANLKRSLDYALQVLFPSKEER